MVFPKRLTVSAKVEAKAPEPEPVPTPAPARLGMLAFCRRAPPVVVVVEEEEDESDEDDDDDEASDMDVEVTQNGHVDLPVLAPAPMLIDDETFTKAALSAAMAARANAALGGTSMPGDGIGRVARLLIESTNTLAPGLSSSSSSNLSTISSLEPREFLSQLSTFGYTFVRQLMETTSDEALRTLTHPQLGTIVQQSILSSRAHDEEMLRTPRPKSGEPACARGDECEATKLVFRNTNTRGKPAMAYWPPHLWFARRKSPTSVPNSSYRYCLLCLRALVTEINTTMMAAGTAIGHSDRAIVDFYNEVDVPNEYRLVDTIGAGYLFNGIAGNIVAHDRHAFALEIDHKTDVYQYKQLYPMPSPTSSSSSSTSSIVEALKRAEQEGFLVASSVVRRLTEVEAVRSAS